MDKTSKKVTKNPKRQERGKKSHETYMKRLKQKFLEQNQMSTLFISFSTCDPAPPTSSSTCDPTPSMPSHTTRSNDTYVYGVDILAVLAIGVCVFFKYRAKNKNKTMIAWRLSRSKKNNINHQNDIICFRSDDEKNPYIINGWF